MYSSKVETEVLSGIDNS